MAPFANLFARLRSGAPCAVCGARPARHASLKGRLCDRCANTLNRGSGDRLSSGRQAPDIAPLQSGRLGGR